MTDISLQQLHCFLAAARELHFTRAADALGLAQPTLSLTIQQLEQTLGTPLFDRLGRSVQLTDAGRLFQKHASALLEDLARARQAIADLANMDRGHLRIGATHILATALLPALLADFHRRHPHIRLKLRKLPSRSVEKQLLSGELDLGITFDPADAPDLLPTKLFDEQIVLALPKNHPLARHKSLRFSELAGLPLALTTPDFATRRLLDSTAKAARIRLHVALEFNDIDLLLATVAAGHLPTLLARRAIGKNHNALTLLPITHPTLTRTAYLLFHRNRYRTNAARTLADMIQHAVKTL